MRMDGDGERPPASALLADLDSEALEKIFSEYGQLRAPAVLRMRSLPDAKRRPSRPPRTWCR